MIYALILGVLQGLELSLYWLAIAFINPLVKKFLFCIYEAIATTYSFRTIL